MHVKTTMKYYLIRMAIKEARNNKCWQGWKKGKPPPWGWECKLLQPIRKTVWRLKKLNTEITHYPAILLWVFSQRK